MPFISVSTTLPLNDAAKDQVAAALGANISLIPNKSEAVLMVDISGGRTMYFGGRRMERCAFVEVRCYKEAPFECNKAFTEAVYRILNEFWGLEAGEVYVSIDERPVWGTKGSLK